MFSKNSRFLKAVYEEPFESFDAMTIEMKVGANLAITTVSHPYNFLILTSALDKRNLLYYCYNTTKTGNFAGVRTRVYTES
jgi:hypothetical protein